MKIQESRKGTVTILELNGRLDASTSTILEKRFLSLLDEDKKDFVLDFSNLDYISSAGLRVLLMAAKRAGSSGGKVSLCRLQEHVREVFDIAGFTAIFPIHASLEEALACFG